MPADMQYLTILISFVSACFSFAALASMVLLVNQMIVMWQDKSGRIITKAMVNRAFVLAILCGLALLFFAAEVMFVAQTGKDVSKFFLLLFNLGVGFFLFMVSMFNITLVEEIKKLSKDSK